MGLGYGVLSGGGVKLRQHRGDVVFHGAGGDEEPVGDFGVGEAFGEKFEYLCLACGQPSPMFAGAVGSAARYRDALVAQSLAKFGSYCSGTEGV